MSSDLNPCKYFADIEANPRAHPPRVTVRQWLMLQEHVYNCDVCYNRMERVCAIAPKELPRRGEN